MVLLCGVPLTVRAQQGDNPNHNMEDPPADLPIPPAPHLSVKDALASMQVEKGFNVACALAEPDVVDPVQMVFDEDGRMWVVEMRGYMPDIDGTNEEAPVGRVSVHEDKDGDGVFETHSVFMDKIVLPRAIAVVTGGVLISEHSALMFIPRVGGRASGPPQVVDPVYGYKGNVEHRSSGLLYGLDNAWHSTVQNRAYVFQDGQWHTTVSRVSGQWGISQDDFGCLVINDNSQPVQLDLMPPGLLDRNEVQDARTPAVKSDLRVYPIRVTPGVNRAYIREGPEQVVDGNWRLSSATATCGLLYYRGGIRAFGDSIFVPEPAGNLVMRYDVKRGNDTVALPHPEHAFIASTDERFRPVNMAMGPDGCMYMVDLNRGVLQHKAFVTTYLRRQIKARNLEDEGPSGWGRIYRVAPDGFRSPERRPHMSKQDSVDLVPYLADANAWWRETAQRVLVGRRDARVVPLLEAMATTHANPVARAHALWTLEGLGALRLETLRAAITTDEGFLITCCVLLSHQKTDVAGARRVLLEMARKETRRLPRAAIAYAEGVLAARIGESPAMEVMGWAKDGIVRQYLLAGLAGKEELAKAGPPELVQSAEALVAKRSALKSPRIPDALTLLPLKPWNGPMAVQWRKGEQLFAETCGSCHGLEGEGTPGRAPPLAGSQWVLGSRRQLITAVMNGVTGPVFVKDQTYAFAEGMPSFSNNPTIDDRKLSEILTYIRTNWGHACTPVTVDDVARVRAEVGTSPRAMTTDQILSITPWPDDAGFIASEIRPGAPARGFLETEGGRVSAILFGLLLVLLGPPILAIGWVSGGSPSDHQGRR